MAEARVRRGIIDTSVLIDLEQIAVADLPDEMAISAITLAELAAGPHATRDSPEPPEGRGSATAMANGLPLYTRNPDDFNGLSDLLEIISI